MKLQIVLLAVALLTIVGPAVGTVYKPCQLARILPQCGLNFKVNDWVCLVMAESSGNTSAVGPTQDYGLFQIHGGTKELWCGNRGPGGDCNIACSALTDNNIADDCVCARKVYNRHGFNAWNGWKDKCQPAPSVTPC